MIPLTSKIDARALKGMVVLLALGSCPWLSIAAFADGGSSYLQGRVNAEDYRSSGPSLKRQDIKGKDAFGGDAPAAPPAGQEFDAPSADFDVPNSLPAMPPPPARPFTLRADDSGNLGPQDFNGNSIPGMPDRMASVPGTPAFGMVPPPAVPTNLKAQDPDSSPEMQLKWDEWHRRVALAIYERYNAMAQLAFRYSRPLAAYVSYTVTRDGRVINVQLQQKSSNIAYNVLILAVVNSLSGQRDILTFPSGSHRSTVDKGGMFTQNYGQQGFKYVTGDRETVRGQGH